MIPTDHLITTIVADAESQLRWAGTTFGARLPRVRTQAGLTQEALAGHLGIARSTIARIERGQTMPTLVTMQRIVAVLDPLIDVSSLLDVMTPEQVDLAAEVDTLTRQLEAATARYAAALSRVDDAEAAVRRLQAENDALRARNAHTETAGQEPLSVPPPFLELTRLHRYLTALYETEREENCLMANEALRYTADLVAEIERQRPGLKDKRRGAA